MRVLENRVVRRIFALKRDEMLRVSEKCIMRHFITCIPCQV
jgi:hypothetical protein